MILANRDPQPFERARIGLEAVHLTGDAYQQCEMTAHVAELCPDIDHGIPSPDDLSQERDHLPPIPPVDHQATEILSRIHHDLEARSGGVQSRAIA